MSGVAQRHHDVQHPTGVFTGTRAVSRSYRSDIVVTDAGLPTAQIAWKRSSRIDSQAADRHDQLSGRRVCPGARGRTPSCDARFDRHSCLAGSSTNPRMWWPTARCPLPPSPTAGSGHLRCRLPCPDHQHAVREHGLGERLHGHAPQVIRRSPSCGAERKAATRQPRRTTGSTRYNRRPPRGAGGRPHRAGAPAARARSYTSSALPTTSQSPLTPGTTRLVGLVTAGRQPRVGRGAVQREVDQQ